MIKITQKEKCCGCRACMQKCPQKCITMKEDEEGFTYPVIDKSRCINCGLCEKVCPIIRDDLYEITKPVTNIKFYAAYNKNDIILKDSSSGGIFWLLVEYVMENQGVVYGAAYEDLYAVKHFRAETLEEAKKFRKSKYLPSDTNHTYEMAEKDLKEGRKVLYSGTPCQISGLYAFLGKNYENLYTCDVVCHGVPSMKVFREYIKSIEKMKKDKVSAICFRDKIHGWGPNHITLTMKSGKNITTKSVENTFHLRIFKKFVFET